jgi:hypothetical protein
MLEQSVRAMIAMDYPHDTWVLDEGDDQEVATLCRRLGARHYSRKHHAQFQADAGPLARHTKYGNYNAWLTEIGAARYDILAAFDPDHVPEPSFLVRVLGYFSDSEVGYVQVPQVYYNQDTSFIARGAAEEVTPTPTHQMSYGMTADSSRQSQLPTHRSAAPGGRVRPHDADDLRSPSLPGHPLARRFTCWILALGMTPVDWHGYRGSRSAGPAA